MAATTILGKLLEDGTKGQTDMTLAHLSIVRAISDYILSNVKTIGIFTGILNSTPFTPGTFPSVNTINTTTLSTTLVTPGQATDEAGIKASWVLWCTNLYTAIRSSCYIDLGPALPVGLIPAFPGLISPGWGINDLKGVGDSEDPHGMAMDIMAMGIMKDLSLGYTPTFPSTYGGAYTGVTTINSIIIP